MNPVRVRFAPSPTGYLHIGGARSALFNYLYARKHKGVFILRIEDTDLERSTEDATKQILDSMKWLGLSWDEGPYFQSKRLELYKKYARDLLDAGSVYRCFCSKEKLEAQRLQAQKDKTDHLYDGCCRNLSPQEAAEKEKSGEPFVLRFRIPDSGETFWNDAVAGEVRFENSRLGDFVIARTDGHPTYNFCVVVDDIDMGITDVIRGADHISNTPRQVLIYNALKTPLPRFAHVPVILGTDRSKLSKRHGAASVMEYAEQGFLPEALFNFLALLGWSPGNDEEIFSEAKLVEAFDLSGVGKANAVFDTEKLLWLNGIYIRSMPGEDIIRRVLDFMPSRGIDPARYDRNWLEGIIALVIERGRTLVELIDQLGYFLGDEISYDEKGVEKISKAQDPVALLQKAHKALSGAGDFSLASLEDAMRSLVEEQKIGFGKIAQPVRLALTGGLASPGLFEVIHYLGKEKTLDRIQKAIAFLEQRKTG
jgi:glutamyl-tRNA synthetase